MGKKIASPACRSRWNSVAWRRNESAGLVSKFFNSTLGEGQRPTERRIQVEEQRITPVGDGVNPGQVVDARQVCVLPSCSCCSFLLCPSYSHSAPFPPPFFPFLFFPPTLPDPFSTVARAIIRPGTRSLPDPGLSAKPRIGVPQKGQIELTGYKLDISSAAFRIKCLFVAHTWTNLLCGRPKKNDHRSRDYTVRTLRAIEKFEIGSRFFFSPG